MANGWAFRAASRRVTSLVSSSVVGGSLSPPGMSCMMRERHPESLIVIWDNSPAHRGDAVRAYLTAPDLNLRLVNPVSSTGQALPSYSPAFNAYEVICGWAHQEVTANLCLGTKAAVREKVIGFSQGNHVLR